MSASPLEISRAGISQVGFVWYSLAVNSSDYQFFFKSSIIAEKLTISLIWSLRGHCCEVGDVLPQVGHFLLNHELLYLSLLDPDIFLLLIFNQTSISPAFLVTSPTLLDSSCSSRTSCYSGTGAFKSFILLCMSFSMM